jgi:hypothetical protein
MILRYSVKSLLSKMMGKLPVSHNSTGSAALSQVVKFKEAKVPLQSCRAIVVALQISQDSHRLAWHNAAHQWLPPVSSQSLPLISYVKQPGSYFVCRGMKCNVLAAASLSFLKHLVTYLQFKQVVIGSLMIVTVIGTVLPCALFVNDKSEQWFTPKTGKD